MKWLRSTGMRLRKVLFIVPLFICTAISAHADGLFLEGGFGFYKSSPSQVLILSYQRDSRPLFGFESYYRAALGSWNGQDRNSAVVLAKGIRVNLLGKSYLCFEPGGAYVTETTGNLGTHLQFVLRSALGVRTEKFDLSLGYKHISNGKGVFHWTKRANHGENFITLQIGYLL